MVGRPQPLRFRWEQTIRRDPRIGGTTLAVLLILATYSNIDGSHIVISIDRLADDCRVSEATARRAVRQGRTLGYLHRIRRGHRLTDDSSLPSEYALTLPDWLTQPVSQPVTRDRLG